MVMQDSNEEYQELLRSLLDGTPSGSDFQALGEILRKDPSARSFYGKYMDLHAMLEWRNVDIDGQFKALAVEPAGQNNNKELGVDTGVNSVDQGVEAISGRTVVLGSLGNLLTSGMAAMASNKALGLAASVIAAFGLAVGLMVSAWLDAPNAPGTANDNYSRLVASVGYVKSSVEAGWSGPAIHQVALGQPLVLDKGLAVITLSNGMELTLEGPAQFLLTSDNSGKLEYGRLVVNVSESNEKFHLKTPSCDILDLGTEFGVGVQGDGTADVQVFEGSISIESHGEQPPEIEKSKRVLTVGEFVRIDGRTGVIQDVSPPPDSFSKSGILAGDFVHTRRVRVKNYDYEGTPSESAKGWDVSYPDKNQNRLIDGVEGTSVFHDSYWVGTRDPMFLPVRKAGDSGTPQPRIDLSLASSGMLSGLSVVYLVDHRAGIHAPDRLRVTLSRTEDFSSELTSIETDEFTDVNPESEGQVYALQLSLPPIDARYVRLDFFNDNEWTFLSEISFVGR